jgi:hypothetical protein
MGVPSGNPMVGNSIAEAENAGDGAGHLRRVWGAADGKQKHERQHPINDSRSRCKALADLRQLGEQLECVSASVGKYDQRTDER